MTRLAARLRPTPCRLPVLSSSISVDTYGLFRPPLPKAETPAVVDTNHVPIVEVTEGRPNTLYEIIVNVRLVPIARGGRPAAVVDMAQEYVQLRPLPKDHRRTFVPDVRRPSASPSHPVVVPALTRLGVLLPFPSDTEMLRQRLIQPAVL